MKKIIKDLTIVRNKSINPDHYLLELLAPEKLPEIIPGQFVEVLIDNSKNTFLRSLKTPILVIVLSRPRFDIDRIIN